MKNKREISILEEDLGIRLDVLLSKKLDISRARAQEYIDQERVFLGDVLLRKSSLVFKKLETIFLIEFENKPIIIIDHESYKKIKILFEHDDFIVVDKPPFLSSHKAHKNDILPNIADWFLQAGLFKDVSTVEDKRVGIIHRLDKETSGVMVLARTYKAQQIISDLFKDRKVKKTYIGITDKVIPESGNITYNIMRDPLNPTRMTYSFNQGRKAETSFQVKKKHENLSLVYFFPKTGRTHQIRVHMQAIKAPLLSDKVYGLVSTLINRHALHAFQIEFEYKGQHFSFKADIPDDIERIF